MKNADVKRVTLAAMLTAISVVVCLLASVFSNMSLSITAITGVFSAMAIICLGYKYAWLVYIATTIFVWIFLPNKECAVFYTVLFGHYPMLKLLTERIGKTCFIWIVKLLEYGLLFAIWVLAFRFLSGIWIAFNSAKTFLFLAFFFVMFILYDICIGRLFFALHTKLSKIIGFH